MDTENVMLSEFSQRQILCDFKYLWNPRYKTNEET